MKLLTKELEARFAKVGSQEELLAEKQMCIAKFFNPTGIGRWFATEYNPEEKMFFGYVSLFGDHCDEWGYFTLEELKSYKDKVFGLGIERDLNFQETPMSEIIKQYTKE